MDDLLQIPGALATVQHHLLLALINSTQSRQIAELIATMALQGPLSIVAGSEWLPLEDAVDMLYLMAEDSSTDPNLIEIIADRQKLVRGFTCYQVVNRLRAASLQPTPLLVVNLLSSFYDIDIRLNVRVNVLRQCTERLEQLARHRPVAVITQHMEGPDYPVFLPYIKRAAHQVIEEDYMLQVISQPRLF
jgi:hypothetical protein